MQCSGFEMKVTGTDDLAFRTYWMCTGKWWIVGVRTLDQENTQNHTKSIDLLSEKFLCACVCSPRWVIFVDDNILVHTHKKKGNWYTCGKDVMVYWWVLLTKVDIQRPLWSARQLGFSMFYALPFLPWMENNTFVWKIKQEEGSCIADDHERSNPTAHCVRISGMLLRN